MRGWEDSEIEKLVAWMEDNRELLRGSTLLWTMKAKEALFNDEDSEIDAKKIKSKYHNMKNSWKAAKKLQDQSGFGWKEEDCESSVNELLNRKCRFFWRLDDIFGERMNNIPTITIDSLTFTQEDIPPIGPDEWPDSDAEALLQEENDSSSEVLNTQPPTSIQTPTPISSQSCVSKRRPSRSPYRERGALDIKALLDQNRDSWTDREEKRLCIQGDIQLQIARMQAESQERLLERQMQMDMDRDERQMQLIQNLITTVVGMMKKD